MAASRRPLLIFNSVAQLGHLNRNVARHPEAPARIEAIRKRLEDEDLMKRCDVFEETDDSTSPSTLHSAQLLESLSTAQSASSDAQLDALERPHDSVFLTHGSRQAAFTAASATRRLVDSVMSGTAINGFALIRPPGHHCDGKAPNGFCLLNNVAEAAHHALEKGAKRVLIVDLDVHHGQGTQRLFYDDQRVLYCSIHRWQWGAFWPHLEESHGTHVGGPKARGTNLNVPLNETGCGDADYLFIMHRLIMPVALNFRPQLVLVSAGFDCLLGDPLGQMRVTPAGYAHLIHQLRSLAQGHVCLVLEGGYNHDRCALAVANCVRVLLGEAPPELSHRPTAPKSSTVDSVLTTTAALLPFWRQALGVATEGLKRTVTPDLYFGGPSSEEDVLPTRDVDQTELMGVTDEEGASVENRRHNARTLVVYTDQHSGHHDVEDDSHPEQPARVDRILEQLVEDGLTERCELRSTNRDATDDEIELVHDRSLIDWLTRTETMTDEQRTREAADLDSIFLTRETAKAARRAAGGVLDCIDAVLDDESAEIRNAFAIVRPPGHHACANSPSGFCLVNNVALAARYAIKKYDLERVLIVDYDVHHGNGTQDIFEKDPRVLFVSLHRRDKGQFYPAKAPSSAQDIGKGPGRGYTLNVPFPNKSSAKDGDYLAAFDTVVMPVAYAFAPQLVLISSGFDAAKDDPLGGFRVSPAGFAHIVHRLCALANGRVVAALEGGYNLEAIAVSAAAVIETLIEGGTRRKLVEASLTRSNGMATALRDVIVAQAPFWPIMEASNARVHEITTPVDLVDEGRRTSSPQSSTAKEERRSTPKTRSQTKREQEEIDALAQGMSALSTGQETPKRTSRARTPAKAPKT